VENWERQEEKKKRIQEKKKKSIQEGKEGTEQPSATAEIR
jgi:hypothetical protein